MLINTSVYVAGFYYSTPHKQKSPVHGTEDIPEHSIAAL
jgi:hypothetical protein